MSTTDRARVVVAGDVFVKRALTRRFLEGEGYEIVGDVMAADDVVPTIGAEKPDVIVLDEDLATQGAAIGTIRVTVPDIRVIVSTAAAPGEGAPPPGADGYLAKGAGLTALTSLLGRFFAEPAVPLEPLLPADRPEASTPAEGTTEAGKGSLLRWVFRAEGGDARRPDPVLYARLAILAGCLLILWGIVAVIGAN